MSRCKKRGVSTRLARLWRVNFFYLLIDSTLSQLCLTIFYSVPVPIHAMKATNVRTVSLVISVPHALMASGGMPRQALVWKMLRTPDRSVRRLTSVKKELAAVIQIHSVLTQTWVNMHLLLFNMVFVSCSQWDPPLTYLMFVKISLSQVPWRPAALPTAMIFPFSGGGEVLLFLSLFGRASFY